MGDAGREALTQEDADSEPGPPHRDQEAPPLLLAPDSDTETYIRFFELCAELSERSWSSPDRMHGPEAAAPQSAAQEPLAVDSPSREAERRWRPAGAAGGAAGDGGLPEAAEPALQHLLGPGRRVAPAGAALPLPQPQYFKDAPDSVGLPRWQMAVQGQLLFHDVPQAAPPGRGPPASGPQEWQGQGTSSPPTFGGAQAGRRAWVPHQAAAEHAGHRRGGSSSDAAQWGHLLLPPPQPPPVRALPPAAQPAAEAPPPPAPGPAGERQGAAESPEEAAAAQAAREARSASLGLLSLGLGRRPARGAAPTGAALSRLLRSEHKRRAAARQALAGEMQELALQLCLLEDREQRVAQLIGQLDCAVLRVRDPASEMLPAISQIVDDLNVERWGAPPFRKRAAAGFAVALADLRPHAAWNQASNSLSSRQVCLAFMEGREAATFQQLAVRGDRPVSLHQIACLSQRDLGTLYREYMDACKAAMSRATESALGEAFAAQRSLARLLKESSLIRVAHIIGQPQMMNLFSRQQPAAIPMEVLMGVVAAARFTQEQLEELWALWRECCKHMAFLKPAEVRLQDALSAALSRAVDQHSRGPRYVELVDTAGELKANLEAQARAVFRFNCTVAIAVLQPMQTAAMHLAAAPHPLRIHLLLLAGLVPQPASHLATRPSSGAGP